MATIYITADRKRVVPAGHADAAFGVAEPDLDRLGLREAYEAFIKPVEEPPKPKAIKKAANKMARRPSDK